ncbi:MAG TPA: hypothetical protein VJH63_00635 [Candidatus Paceibacterota bacterium]
MSKLDQIATKIIKEQELIIGPIAWQEAGEVKGIHIIDQKTGAVTIDNGDSKIVVDNLVGKYEHLFGRASREVCREAVASLVADLSPSEVPSSLK